MIGREIDPWLRPDPATTSQEPEYQRRGPPSGPRPGGRLARGGTSVRSSIQGYDAVVVGVGGMGAAACYHLARRSRRVLGLERFDVPHALGSSHGITRIIRLAYYEHPAYVPLLRRAYELWRELETGFGEQLLHLTGSIDASGPDEVVF